MSTEQIMLEEISLFGVTVSEKQKRVMDFKTDATSKQDKVSAYLRLYFGVR